MRKVYSSKRELSYTFWFYYIRMYEFASPKPLNHFLKNNHFVKVVDLVKMMLIGMQREHVIATVIFYALLFLVHINWRENFSFKDLRLSQNGTFVH